MEADSGSATWGWLLGDGQSRGIALVFVIAGLVMVVVGVLAFFTRSYRVLSTQYRSPTAPVGETAASPDTGSRGMPPVPRPSVRSRRGQPPPRRRRCRTLMSAPARAVPRRRDRRRTRPKRRARHPL
ncbi:hypothetical protein HR12_31755 [Microbacterium sp. SUBG005]|nr:hypothetical protein HR12_31755 [Microbacterium sp. SUBG005]